VPPDFDEQDADIATIIFIFLLVMVVGIVILASPGARGV